MEFQQPAHRREPPIVTPLRLLLAGALLAFPVGTAAAHSLDELERELSGREQYFQPLAQPAPSFALKDADGRPVHLTDFAGKVVVLQFIYASCTDVCPVHADLFARIQEMVNATPMRDRVQFVSITTDPVGDTPEVLRAFGPAHGLDAYNWIFLTSGLDAPDDTRALVERFGHRFDVLASGVQIHGVVTHVIDREGRWRANFHGLQFDPTSLVVFVNALVNDVHQAGERRDESLWEQLRQLF